jgi:hypothetical protein
MGVQGSGQVRSLSFVPIVIHGPRRHEVRRGSDRPYYVLFTQRDTRFRRR